MKNGTSCRRVEKRLSNADGPIVDPAWSVHEVDLEELVLAYMGEQREPRLQSLPPRLEANG